MMQNAWAATTAGAARRRWLPLVGVLVLGLALRAALWGNLPRTGFVSDEGEYLASAAWLAEGRGFSWHLGWLWTRAPLYPLFLAAHIRLFGLNLAPIYVSQTLLGLLHITLTFLLAERVAAPGRRAVPMLAAALTAIFFPLAIYNQVLLSESLYVALVLAALLALAHWSTEQRARRAIALLVVAGALVGLATLTRGLAIGFAPLAAGWIWLAARRKGAQSAERRAQSEQSREANAAQRASFFILHPSSFVLAFLAVLLPWSFYASRTYGGPIVVDTTSAFNLMLGARTAHDGKRTDEPPRNFVLALLEQNPKRRPQWVDYVKTDACLARHGDTRLAAALAQPVAAITQAQRQQLMMAEGLCLVGEAPLAFVTKSVGELIDFFRINYGGDERFVDGFSSGRLAPAYVLGTFLLDDTLYVLALPLAVIGLALARRAAGAQGALAGLIGTWLLYNLAAVPLLFAINRFRVPLMPLLFIYASYALAALTHGAWRALRGRLLPHALLAALLLFVAVAPAGWISQCDGRGTCGAQQSYFGPHPSSVRDTLNALQSRPLYQRTIALRAALGGGDVQSAASLLEAVPTPTQALGSALLAGLAGRIDAGLALLPSAPTLAVDGLWDKAPQSVWGDEWRAQAGVARGDLLRRKGDAAGAKAAMTPTFVDELNPVEWAWQWLHPPPLPDHRIDLAGNLDLGYIRGFYGGYGVEGATWRWSGPVAQLRFPQAGTGAPQVLRLRVDGRARPDDARFDVLLGDQLVASTPLSHSAQTYEVPLPASPAGADVLITLRTPPFVPNAADFLAQQGPQAGQLRLLGLLVDWAELR